MLAVLCASAAAAPRWKFLGSYPAHYVAKRLGPGEAVRLDGVVDGDPVWDAVPWTKEPFVDITVHANQSMNEVPPDFQAAAKIRWDDDYLYVAAKLREPFLHGTVTGHNTGPQAPYADNDFEVFVDVSGTTQYYKEFEMNAINATYDVNWGVPDGAGLRCDDSDRKNESMAYLPVCVNTSFPGYDGSWTMVGGKKGMVTATSYDAGDYGEFVYPSSVWTLEIAFPIRGGEGGRGGLLDADGLDFSEYDPNRGDAAPGRPRYWRLDFARAEHPRFYNATGAGADSTYCPFDCPRRLADKRVVPQLTNPTQDECAAVLERWPTLLGVHPWNCYWEWVWEPLGAEAYMHRPLEWGVVQFASRAVSECKDIEHPPRYVSRMVYHAQVEYFKQTKGYAKSVQQLLSDEFCKAPSCSVRDLSYAAGSDVFGISITVVDDAKVLSAECTARPCFTATVTSAPGESCIPAVSVSINENMLVVTKHGEAEEGCGQVCL